VVSSTARLPASVRAEVGRALETSEGDADIVAVSAIGGGCISPAARIRTAAGRLAFIKWSGPGTSLPGFFHEEARSLEALEASGQVRVPAVLGFAEDWLLLEWLSAGPPVANTWSELGRALARLHRFTDTAFGWPTDNYIGSLPQTNTRSSDWPTFWLERRIVPQWEQARRQGYFGRDDERRLEAIRARADSLLVAGNADGPSLLHGDFWGGNVHILEDGTAALIDPSSSFGHREVDLAMARLFGGFGADFFNAYREAWPLQPDADTRTPLYQLYYVLVHVNLFGAGYVAQTRSILGRYG